MIHNDRIPYTPTLHGKHTEAADERELRSSERGEHDASDNQNLLPPAQYSAVGGTFELLQMMLESSHKDRSAKKDEARAVDESLRSAQKAQISELKSKAHADFRAGMTSGVASLGKAALTMASSLEKTQSDAKLNALTTNENTAQSAIDAFKSNQAARKLGIELSGELLEVGSASLKAGIEHAGALSGIAATEHEMRASSLERSAQGLRSDLDEVKAHENKLMDIVRDIESAMNRCAEIALQSR